MTDKLNVLGAMLTAGKITTQPPESEKPAAEQTEQPEQPIVEGERAWTSHPVPNYMIGRFKFEKGVLKLNDPADIKEFENYLNDKNLPASEKNRIRELDISSAEAISRKFIEEQGGATKAIDSSTGDRGVKPMQGKVDLANAPQGGAVQQ